MWSYRTFATTLYCWALVFSTHWARKCTKKSEHVFHFASSTVKNLFLAAKRAFSLLEFAFFQISGLVCWSDATVRVMLQPLNYEQEVGIRQRQILGASLNQ